MDRRIGFALLCVASAVTVACKTTTLPSPSPASSPPPSSPPVSTSPSPSPGPKKIGTCVIQPQTNCKGASLSGAPLAYADLHGSKMSAAVLRGADLNHANLRGVDFRNADLRGADLAEARLQHSNLSGARLDGADLSYANLTGATATSTQFAKATLCGTITTSGTTDDSGCRNPFSPSPGPASTTPTITSFAAGDANCLKNGHKFSNSKVKYATQGATRVVLSVNDQPVTSTTTTSGSMKVRVPCSGHTDTVGILAKGASGKTAEKRVSIQTGI